MKTFIRHTIAAGLISLSALTQANTFHLDGVITQCIGLCSLYVVLGQTAHFSFDTADGLTFINHDDIGYASFKTQSMTDEYLEFSPGIATQANLSSNGQGKLLSGNVNLRALSPYSGIYANADINIDTGFWAMSIDTPDGSAEVFAAGYLTGGDIAEVPVPAAAWLFGSALMMLGGSLQRQRYGD